MSSTKTPTVGFISLGCPKALVDSERILTQLKLDGYDIVPSYEDADAVVVNTCGFIDSAKQESLDAISEAMKENGKVIVTGCMGKGDDAKRIMDTNPCVLSVTGPAAYEEVVGAVHQYIPPVKNHNPFVDLVPDTGIKLTPRHYAYLKISEGCNHKCSFCIIPDMRGKLVSRPIGDVLDEAERLANAGVKEVLVVSQDTSAYGVDLKYRTGFWQGKPVKTKMDALCEALGDLGIWVRMHYVYPYPNVDDIIPMMNEGKILPYLDIPFQHSSPSLLKLMKRPASSEDVLERIKNWRSICPDLTIRSTFIVGHPGETEEDFEHLLNFLDEAQLDRVGCFQYSPVEGARANDIPGIVPDDIKQQRFERFMEKQQTISTARLAKKVGTKQAVIIDEVDEEGAIGRSMADAPEIDGLVYLNDEFDVAPGDIVEVTITHSDEYDLWGEI
jgi:ribosomal protein S12 methylthiotransferase